jgi:hypothetical protein
MAVLPPPRSDAAKVLANQTSAAPPKSTSE